MNKLLTFSEKISKYLIATVLIIVPLLPKFPLIKVPGTYVAIRFEDLLLLILAIILVPSVIVSYKKILKDPLITAFLIFLGVGLVSLLSGAFLTQTVDLRLGFMHWARRLEYLIPFFAAYLLIPKKDFVNNLNFYFKILLMVVFIIFLYGMGQHYLHFPVITTQNNEYSRGIALFWIPGSNTSSTFAGQYDLAAFIVLVMPIFLSAIFVFKDKLSKFFIAVVSGSGLWLLVNSFSRISQLSYLVAVSLPLIFLKKFKGLALVLIISITFMMMSSGLSARFGQAIYVIYHRITVGESFSYLQRHFVALAESVTPTSTPVPVKTPKIQDVSIAIRANVEWPRAFRAFTKNPILGTGYSSLGLAVDSDYLRMLGEIGILGLAAFCLIFYRIGKDFIKMYLFKNKLSELELAYFIGMIGSVFGTLVIATFIDLFEASKFATIFWLLLGLAMNMVKNNVYEQ